MSQRKTSNNSNNNDITFYHYSRFENIKIINKNVYKADIKKIISQQKKTVAEVVVVLKCISLNNNFTLNNFINEVKRHRKLEISDNILKFYGITKQENTNNYMIVREYANNGSLRQYLRTNFQKLDWNVKLNLSKQIANSLMNLHSNNIIHGKLTSERIILWEISCDGILPFENESLTKLSSALSSTNNNIIDLINDIITKGKREKCIPGIPPKYKEIYADCLKHHGNSRPDIIEVVSDLSEINIVSDINVTNNLENPNEKNESLTKLSSALSSTNNNIIDLINDIITKGKREKCIPGIPPKYKEIYADCLKHHGNSRPDIIEVVSDLSEINIVSDINVTNNLENPNEKVQSNPPHINFATTTTNNFNISVIKKLFEFFINLFKTQSRAIRPIMMNDYIKEHNLNSVKILHKMIRYSSNYWFTSLIGFFIRMASGLKFYNINKEIGIIRLAHVYCHGLGVERDLEKCFQIYSKAAGEGSHAACRCMANCYENGNGVEKNKEKAFELYLKSEKGDPQTQFNVGSCFVNGVGIAKDETKGLQWFIKSALSGNIDAIYEIGYHYDKGICVDVDKNESFKWYFKGAEKGYSWAQYKLGIFCEYGNGINQNQVKAFEWYKKAAENGLSNSQFRLGECFYNGYGTKKDIVKAIYWLNKANENEFFYNRLLYEIIELYN
ncbi:hypothetical protein Glove_50g43 [Diversispora epigaea]|uniref:Protein kinase domain-containing protein n=1 Tax=Diversispora epigaea TaxID=1348612 RepID=A0A397JPV7_9GLOM|nr:hypothetical protein Glove_50g43 [Diversispora epigaea]